MQRPPPVRVVRVASAVRTTLQGLTRRMVPPQIGLLELASGFMATHAVYAAARLGVADVLANGPRTAVEIATAVGAQPDATRRLLRACAGLGVFREEPDGRFGLSPLAKGLRSDTPDSILPVILMLGDPQYQSVWGRLADTVRTGEPGAEQALGRTMWEHLADDTRFAAIFNDAMTRLTALDWPTVDAAYDFTRFSTIVDVGGGHGQLLALMLGAAPDATGVLLEQESLTGEAAGLLEAAGVHERCRIMAGSFFETAPTDGDLYVLRRVIHDFDDEDAVAILRNLRAQMPRTATLLLMESVVPPGNEPHFAKSLDLDMLLFVGGRERTEPEFAALLQRAGFRAPQVIATISAISLIESGPDGGQP